MKFDFVIGNPPYQADVENEGDRANPVYDKFMDVAFGVADCVELIHPARFLFNAGQTPKAWNKKMLQDEHFKVLEYEPDATRVFPNTEIKGGVAITFRNSEKQFGPIGTFTSFEELRDIISKVREVADANGYLNSIIASQGLFRFSKEFFEKNPNAVAQMGKGTGSKIVSSAVEKFKEVFTLVKKSNNDLRFLSRIDNQRSYRYIPREFLDENEYMDKYKLFIPEANNTGKFGEELTDPVIGFPGEGSSDTYLSAGPFGTEIEARNLARYMKTKFFRALLGVKKVTQHCPPHVWEMVPLQDFTSNSDIDWSKPVKEIDQQLYKKYGLFDEEIEFIESHVKEME